MILPLTDLIADVGQRSQIWVTTRSRVFAQALAERGDAPPIQLALANGETSALGHGRVGVGDG
ncbi:MAG: hypothetical protein IT457_20615 [Planctomycetes bacterium]|nr:hypothetical protein [Planctomycetota bacterium]